MLYRYSRVKWGRGRGTPAEPHEGLQARFSALLYPTERKVGPTGAKSWPKVKFIKSPSPQETEPRCLVLLYL